MATDTFERGARARRITTGPRIRFALGGGVVVLLFGIGVYMILNYLSNIY